MTTFNPTPRPRSSIWGEVQDAKQWRPGIWSVGTAGHGGIIVSAERLAAMPAWMRSTAYSTGGQFEEDCDWCLPVLAFASEFGDWKAFPAQSKPVLDFAREHFSAFVANGYFKPPADYKLP